MYVDVGAQSAPAAVDGVTGAGRAKEDGDGTVTVTVLMMMFDDGGFDKV